MKFAVRLALVIVCLPELGAAQASAPATQLPLTPLGPMHAIQASYTLSSLAPVLIVDAVEPSIAFWTEQLGFSKENEVPGPDGKLIFASVRKDGVEIMYQTRASVIAEGPTMASELNGRSAALFIKVPSLADLGVLERQTKGATVVKPRHDTFYGTTEFYIREPGGHVVGFAAPKA
jgi:uncharacterized glyoxalase superfamily protein PhnB